MAIEIKTGMHCDLILASLWHGGKVGNGQATGSRIPPCRRTAAVVAVLRGPSTCSRDEPNCLAPPQQTLFPLQQGAVLTRARRQQRPAGMVSVGLPLRLAALRSGFRTSPFKITSGRGRCREAHELPASLSPCHAAAVPCCRVGPSLRSATPRLRSR